MKCGTLIRMKPLEIEADGCHNEAGDGLDSGGAAHLEPLGVDAALGVRLQFESDVWTFTAGDDGRYTVGVLVHKPVDGK